MKKIIFILLALGLFLALLLSACGKDNTEGTSDREPTESSAPASSSVPSSIETPSDDTPVSSSVAPEEKEYTVSFLLNGGTMAEQELLLKEGSVLSFAAYQPVREGYDFSGWACEDKLFTLSDSYIVTGPVTFSAVWIVKESDPNAFVFALSEDGSYYILADLAEDFALTRAVVPGTYQGKPVKEIANGVFSYCDALREIDLSRCTALEKIGSYNFSYCPALAAVRLTGCAALVEIGDSCFHAAPALAEIDLRGLSALASVGNSCFNGYEGSQAGAVNGMPLTVLDFSDCRALKHIGQFCFWYLDRLETLDLSATSLETVERQCIKSCPALMQIGLPATLRPDGIGSEFITDCDSLKEIFVHKDSLYLSVCEGVLYDADLSEVLKCPAHASITSYTAPASVVKVRAQAFKNAVGLAKIDFSACRLSEIEFQAFDGCRAALLCLPFDAAGYYQDGSTVTCGSGWNRGVKELRYGPRYLFFTLYQNELVDGMIVAQDTMYLSAYATFGDDRCSLSVTVNGIAAEETDGRFLLPFAEGENTVVLTAASGGRRESWSYTVTKSGRLLLKTDLAGDEITAQDTLSFHVWVEDATGGRVDASGLAIDFAYDSDSFSGTPFGGFEKDYDPESMTYTLVINNATLYDFFYFFDFYKIRLRFALCDDITVTVFYSAAS